MSFTTFIDDSFPYNNNNTWENVYNHQITIPDPFIGNTFTIGFNMNLFTNGSAYSDKELAFYWQILDANSVSYKGFTFNIDNPWANWFNPSQYTNTSQNPMPVCYTDYYNFTAPVPVNPLTFQLYMYGAQTQSQKIKATILINSMNVL
jgi:hypothetical protein